MKLNVVMSVIALGTAIAASAAELPKQEPMRLWEKDAPGAQGQRPVDIPSITPYFPEKPAKLPMPAVVVCPGGAYGGLAIGHEGDYYAKFLNQHGIAAFVLKYRLGSQKNGGYRYPVMNWDAWRAIRTVRANAKNWNINPEKIGIMGSSAGGHLAAMTAVKNDKGDPKNPDVIERQSSRPDFAILCYAQTSMDKRYGACCGSKNNLIGGTATPEQDVAAYRFVSKETPPFFIWHTWADPGVPVQNALDMAEALNAWRIPFDLHIFQNGGHGMGLRSKPPFKNAHPWSGDLVFWLKEQKIIQ